MKNSSTKILTIAVILLLLVNIAMVVFMVRGKKHPASKRGDKGAAFEMMVKELNMTEQQQADFKKLKEEHFRSIRPVFDSIRTLKQSLFGLVKDETAGDSAIASYSSLIAAQQSIADKRTIDHFRKVRTLFSGDQQKKFDDVLLKMIQRKMNKKPGDSASKKDQ